jgi:hypothetical protein
VTETLFVLFYFFAHLNENTVYRVRRSRTWVVSAQSLPQEHSCYGLMEAKEAVVGVILLLVGIATIKLLEPIEVMEAHGDPSPWRPMETPPHGGPWRPLPMGPQR